MFRAGKTFVTDVRPINTRRYGRTVTPHTRSLHSVPVPAVPEPGAGPTGATGPGPDPAPLGDPALLEAFWRYERALIGNDVPELDGLFAPGGRTLRADAGAALVGHDHIAAFRAGRGGVPHRQLTRVHLRALADGVAVLVAESVRADGGTGVQTQVWERGDGGSWRVSTAHVSTVPALAFAPVPGADVDPTIWRVPPGPAQLRAGSPGGPLTGARVAVKDLFAVAGERIGAGNPTWVDAAPIEATDADAVRALLEAGADVAGIAHTDELAFALAGENVHYGAPPNPAAPGRITGGSTSGPAAAVAAGVADIGLGTDTAGSIRVPASYCGLYGLRTTHDAVSRDGLVGLAPSFDTVGVLTRDAATLSRAAGALLPPAAVVPTETIVVVDELMGLAEPDARLATEAALRALALRAGARVEAADLDPELLASWFAAFRTVQQAQAWATHRSFVQGHGDRLDAAVAARFRAGAEVDDELRESATEVLAAARDALVGALPDGVLLALPSTSSTAPPVGAKAAVVESTRAATLRLTCLASLAGLPQVSIPAARVGTLPLGLGLVGGPGADRSLLALLTQEAR